MTSLLHQPAWALRAAWALLPMVAGPAFAAALDPTSGPLRTAASIGLWAVWAGALLATWWRRR
jgi:hypothetical protein